MSTIIVLVVVLPILAAFLLPLLPGVARRMAGPLTLLTMFVLGVSLWQATLASPVVLAVGGYRPLIDRKSVV